jgi:uroporphyrinogen III methyltransferase/synthase
MKTLAGRRILVTRAAEEPPSLDDLLRDLGAEPIRLPCIAFASPSDRGPLDAALARLRAGRRPAYLAIASAHAADRLVAEIREAGLVDVREALSGVSILAAGAATVRHLESLGLAARAPAEGVGAEAMVAAFGPEVRGKEVLVPRAEEGNPALPEGLRRAGARIEAVPLYRTVPAATADPAAAALLRAGAIDAIAFASGSAARGFAALFGPEAASLAQSSRVACLGETCAEAARAAGLPVHSVAAGGFPDFARAIESLLSKSSTAERS